VRRSLRGKVYDSPMRAVLLEVSEADLASRRRTGLDRWDEVWEGVLHMAPAPTDEHQRIVDELIEFLRPLLRKSGRGTLRSGINVFDETSPVENYRIPDLSFVSAERTSVMKADGIRGGGPDAVIEVRSPADETYEKLPFFAKLGVREVVVIDRDTKAVEVFRLTGDLYDRVAADAEGALQSDSLSVRFVRSTAGRLVVEDLRQPGTKTEI
jgi:Uma2 family endonuclease